MSFRDKYIEKISKETIEYITCNYNKINKKDMKKGEGLFNNKCQLNAIENIKNNKAEDIYLCAIFDGPKDTPVIHFINKKDDKFIDNTLGWLYEENEYYLIRKIKPKEYCQINLILFYTKELLLKACSNKFLNKILDVNSSIF